MILFFLYALVVQNGDTLFFVRDNVYSDTVVMHEYFVDAMRSYHSVRKAKVSPDGKTYLIYSAHYTPTTPETLLTSSITFYDAEKRKLLEQRTEGERGLSYDLSDVHDSLFVVATWDNLYRDPALYVFKDGERKGVVEQGDWERIVSYVISSNGRYLLFHTRNPYYNKPWDYIYFCDLVTGKTWDYIFPSCLSCKKTRIYLELDDDGRSRVIHKNEYRVFSADGVLEDIYLKLE